MGAINKTFVSNLLMLIGVNLLIKPFYLLIIEAQVQERIGAENFGLYFALLNISFILNILPDLGITNWNNRNIAQQGIIHRTELYKLLRLRLILGGIYIAACLIVGFLLNYDNSSVTMLIVLAFNQVLATGILFFRSYLSGMHRFAADRIISVSDRILLILMLGGALITTSEEEAFPIDYLIYGQTIAYALTLLLAFIFVKRFSSHEITERSSNTSSILSSSLPFATLILVSMMSSRIDSIMLERMGGSFQAGIYAMSFRLGDMLTMISYLFAVMLLPIFSRLLAKQKNPAELFGIAFRMLLVGCTSIVALCVLNPSWILSIIYDQHIEEASLILPWTMAGAALFSLQYTTGTLLTSDGRMKPLILISSLALLCNVLLNTQLIPIHLAAGAAQAAFVSQALVFILQSILVQTYYRVWTPSLITHSIAFVLLSACSLMLIHASDWAAPLEIFILAISIASAAILLRMLPLQDMLSNFKTETNNTAS